MKTSILIFVLAFTSLAQEPKKVDTSSLPNINIKSRYDRFSNLTTIAVTETLIQSGTVDLGGGSLYYPPGTSSSSLAFSIVGSFEGQDAITSIPKVAVIVSSVSQDWRFLNPVNLIQLLIDGHTRVLLGEAKRVNSETRKNGGVIEQLLLEVPFGAIEQLSQAAKLEIWIGREEAELRPSQLGDIREWVEKFPAAKTILPKSEAAKPLEPAIQQKPMPGTEVQVKGYYRKNGTYVKPHTRSAPRKHAHAQSSQTSEIDWKFIKEMSGEVPDHPGITFKTYAAQIARGNDRVKLILKTEFPHGAPSDIFRDNVPFGFDVSSVERFEGRLEFNCQTLVVKPVKASGVIYQFNGARHKTKEPPFAIGAGHIFATYFCEQGKTPTAAPKLKP